VLDLARLEARHVELDVRRCSIASLLALAEPLVAPQLEGRGITLDADIVPGLETDTDGEKVVRILVNLLANAAKYTPSGSRVAISAMAEGEYVVIRVCDGGPGVAPELRATLFEPFVRGAGRIGAEGTGLGLAISRALARALGGELELESATGGSVFRLTLPSNPPAAPPLR
jgi:two-component system sensor histidine kinase KdpD